MNPPPLPYDSLPDPRATPASISVLVVLGALALYRILHHYDIPLRAIPETLWNSFVHLAPASLVFALGKPSTTVDANTSDANMFAAKNEVLRKALGFEGTGIFKAMAGDRTLRGIGSLLNGQTIDKPAGLGNWDNSCYQNSVIQGLASLPSLEVFLSKVISQYEKLGDDSTNSALFDTILKLNDPENHGSHLWTPAKLKSMSSWQQQDAQEYFSKVLDEVDREILQVVKETESQKTAGLEDLPSQSGAAEPVEASDTKVHHEELQPTNSQEPLRNPLEGLLAQRVGCMTCGFTEGLSMIPFNCLTVPLGKDWDYNIRECLDEYTKLEPIEGVECAKCTLLRTRDSLANMLNPDGDMNRIVSDDLRTTVSKRLELVQKALDDEDFSDSTLTKQCQISKKNWVASTKSRQAVVARAPKSLIVHVNRSVFDEMTGAQRKNCATVSFPKVLDLQSWSLGNGDVRKQADGKISESWSTDPAESMLSHLAEEHSASGTLAYELRAVVTHYGRHENGHYICYRKHPFTSAAVDSDENEEFEPAEEVQGQGEEEEEKTREETPEETERWWRLSDEDVSPVTEDDVLRQGGVFMLFYERKEIPSPASPTLLPEVDIDDQVEAELFADAVSEPDQHDTFNKSVSRKSSTMTIKAHADDADPSVPPVPRLPDNISLPESSDHDEFIPTPRTVSRKSSVMTIKAHGNDTDDSIPPVPSLPKNFSLSDAQEPDELVSMPRTVSRKASSMTIKAHDDDEDASVPPVPPLPDNLPLAESSAPDEGALAARRLTKKSSTMTIKASADDVDEEIPPVPLLPQDIPIPTSPERFEEEEEDLDDNFLPRFDYAFSSHATEGRPVTPPMGMNDGRDNSPKVERTIEFPAENPIWSTSLTPSTPSAYDDVMPMFPPSPTDDPHFTPTMRMPNSPNTRRILEETIEEEETDSRWTTSRSEYAPSTVATSEGGDVSDHVSDLDYESGADDGSEAGLELPPLPPSPQQQRQRAMMLRTAAPGTGQGRSDGGSAGEERERMSVEGLRMVAAT